MKRFFYTFLFLTLSSVSFAQSTINPFAPKDESVPDLVEFAEANDLTKMKGDTLILIVPYLKRPYSRPDATWGYIDGDIYMTYEEVTYCEKEEINNKQLLYLRDYKNKKPTRFVLHTKAEMDKVLKLANSAGEDMYFFRAEKFVVLVTKKGNITNVTLKRANVPKFFTVKIGD